MACPERTGTSHSPYAGGVGQARVFMRLRRVGGEELVDDLAEFVCFDHESQVAVVEDVELGAWDQAMEDFGVGEGDDGVVVAVQD